MNPLPIDIYVNVQTSQQVSPVNGLPCEPTRLRRGGVYLLRFHLVTDSSLTPFVITAGMTFMFGMDSVFTSSHADPVLSNNARFLSADWPGATGWDLAYGRLCCRAFLNTPALTSDMASASEKTYYAALWAIPPVDDAFPLFQIQIPVDNIAVDISGAVEPDSQDAFITAEGLASIIVVPSGKRLRVTDSGEIVVEEIT